MRKRISQSPFEEQIGYSRAVVDGPWIFVSGTTGYNYKDMTISNDIKEQTRQCLENIIWALQEADAELKDVVRVHYIVPNANEFESCWPILKEYFGDIRPAATMFSAGLMNPQMKIEIEVTCYKS